MNATVPILPEPAKDLTDVSRAPSSALESPPAGKGGRLRIFLGLFTFFSVLGLTYCFLRPAMYQAMAVLILKPSPAAEGAGTQGAGSPQGDKSELIVARQVLMNHSILDEVRRSLEKENKGQKSNGTITVDEIQQAIRVELIPEGNLIRLYAQGQDRAVVARLLESWISVYMSSFEESQRRALATSMDSMDKEIGALEDRLEAKRQELEIYRKLNDIVSLQREENNLVARLRGLNESLSRTRERLVNARARLRSLEEAKARGESILEGRELSLVTSLEQKAESLRDQLQDLGQRYTKKYMALDPKVRNLRAQLQRTEEKIQLTRIQAEASILDAARQEVAGAQRALTELEDQIKEYKNKIQDFNDKFARHEALVEEVKSLEALVRARAQNRMQKDIAPEEYVPQLSLLEAPVVSERPVRPHHLRDMGISVAGAFVLSLLGIWLLEFLQRSPEKREHGHGTTLIFQPNVVRGPDLEERPLLTSKPNIGPSSGLRELSPLEVAAMVEKAPPEDALMLGLLLSGVRGEELEDLRWAHVDLERGVLRVPGAFQREIPMPGVCIRSIHALMDTRRKPERDDRDGEDGLKKALIVDAHGNPLKGEAIEKRLTCLAQEAGLAAPTEVTMEALRHTYLLFLVRQGIRLSSLEKVAGEVPHAMFSHYGAYVPPGSGKDLEGITRIMPVLE